MAEQSQIASSPLRDLNEAAIVMNKLDETLKNFELQACSILGVSEQWSKIESEFAMVEVRAKELESKAGMLESKEREIGKIEKNVKKLLSELKVRSDEVNVKEKSADECRKVIEREKREVLERYREMEVLKEEVEVRQREVEGTVGTKAELEKERKEIDEKWRELEEKWRSIGEVCDDVEEREEEMRDFGKVLEEKEKGIDDRCRELDSREEKMKGLERVIDDRFRKLEEKEKGIDERCRELDLREEEMKGIERTIDKCRKIEDFEGLESREKETIIDRIRRLDEREKEMDERCKEVDLGEKRLIEICDQMDLKEKELNEGFMGVRSKEEELIKRRKEFGFKEKKIGDLLKQLMETQARMIDLSSSLEEQRVEFNAQFELVEFDKSVEALNSLERQINESCKEVELCKQMGEMPERMITEKSSEEPQPDNVGVLDDNVELLFRNMDVGGVKSHVLEEYGLGRVRNSEDLCLIQSLISRGKLIEAVKHICACNMREAFPPEPLLEAHLESIQKTLAEVIKEANDTSQNDADRMEFDALQAMIKCISDLKLESSYSTAPLELRITQLEKEMEERNALSQLLTVKKYNSPLGGNINSGSLSDIHSDPHRSIFMKHEGPFHRVMETGEGVMETGEASQGLVPFT